MAEIVKVKVLRSFRSGENRGVKGAQASIPAALAAALSKGTKPAVEIIKEKP